jgi:hypothetical protein
MMPRRPVSTVLMVLYNRVRLIVSVTFVAMDMWTNMDVLDKGFEIANQYHGEWWDAL